MSDLFEVAFSCPQSRPNPLLRQLLYLGACRQLPETKCPRMRIGGIGIIYLVNHTKVEACNVGNTLTRSSWSTLLKMKRYHETYDMKIYETPYDFGEM